MTTDILLVDDEEDILSVLEYTMRREGYSTRRARCGAEALAEAARTPVVDLVVLDLMLPDASGTEVCRRLRAQPDTAAIPVLMLSARGEEVDRVVGFEVGADDYVVKPFSPRELMLRVRAILKRGRPRDAPAAQALHFGALRVDVGSHEVFVGVEAVRLTALEFRLLTCFLGRRGHVQTREALLGAVWNIQADITTRTVDTHVRRLRDKLGAAGAYIETLRGVGYRFAARPPPARAPGHGLP